jgi:hypothetical protein
MKNKDRFGISVIYKDKDGFTSETFFYAGESLFDVHDWVMKFIKTIFADSEEITVRKCHK